MKRSELRRRTPIKAKPRAPKYRPISPATNAQREATQFCIISGARRDEDWTIDPAHLCARAHGGCDDPLCVVGLRRDLHEQFDRGQLDVLPYLLAHKMVPQINHALEHYGGDLLGLLMRLTGDIYVPLDEAA